MSEQIKQQPKAEISLVAITIVAEDGQCKIDIKVPHGGITIFLNRGQASELAAKVARVAKELPYVV